MLGVHFKPETICVALPIALIRELKDGGLTAGEYWKSISLFVDARFRSFLNPPGRLKPERPLSMKMFYVSRNMGVLSRLRSQPAYMLLGRPGLCRAEPEIHAAKCMKDGTVLSEPQLKPAACSDHARGKAHPLLDHRLYSSALGRMTKKRKSLRKPILPWNAKEARGDHLIFLSGKGRLSALQLQAGPNQHLPFGVRYPRRYPDRPAQPIGFGAVAPGDPRADHRTFLSRPRFRGTAFTKN